METVQRDYAPEGVRFYYIYKALAHPELSGYVSPFTLQERLLHVSEARKKLGSSIPWLCDTMSNDLKHALGNASNSEFVMDPKGIVVSRKAWSQPVELRKLLEKLVGPVEKPTRVSDLRMPPAPGVEQSSIATGIVPRVQLPGRMVPLKISPVIQENEVAFYAKLRAEVTPAFLERGKGQLYLGFHLDRLYGVHWNNLTEPLSFQLYSPKGVRLTPAKGVGPHLKEPADKDPREFLVDIAAESFSAPLDLTVRYFACDDANTFCIPVTQRYAIHLQRDRDGGSAFRRRRSDRRGGGFLNRLRDSDTNGDGRIGRDEVPEAFKSRFSFLDANGDGFIDEKELESAAQRRRGGLGGKRFVERVLENDADGDGRISRQEAPPPLLHRFDKVDTDGDGYLDKEELRVAAERLRRTPSRP
ncbi:MAG: EF-hand domain-containing protein [Acidobacteriota bacterium]